MIRLCTWNVIAIGTIRYPSYLYDPVAPYTKTNGVGVASLQDFWNKALEETTDTYVFIVTKVQWNDFEKVVEKYGWDKYITFKMPDFVSNYNYPEQGRKLRLVVMKGQGKTNAN